MSEISEGHPGLEETEEGQGRDIFLQLLISNLEWNLGTIAPFNSVIFCFIYRVQQK